MNRLEEAIKKLRNAVKSRDEEVRATQEERRPDDADTAESEHAATSGMREDQIIDVTEEARRQQASSQR